MGYLYRNPQLQIDLPQPEPESRLVLNLETRRYLRLGLRDFEWLRRIDGQVDEQDVAALFGIESSLAQELIRRLVAAKLVCVSAEPVQLQAVASAPATELDTRRLEWVSFGQLRLHLGRPKAILEPLRPVVRFLMRKGAILGLVLFTLFAFFLADSQAAAILRGLRGFSWSFTHVAEIMAMLLVATTLHEFGHAAACNYFGAPVRSIGFMIFYLQPAAYADVTDSWQLRNRWHRVMIAFAGTYVQIILTNLSLVAWTLLRWAHRPTDLLLLFASLNISIIIFNLLPFVKLDGYWILSSAIAVPNLRNRAMEWTRQSLLALVKRQPVQPKDLSYSAVLKMSPEGQALLFLFGLSSIVFGISMWITGLGFLFRVTRWMHMRRGTSYWAVGAAVTAFLAVYLVKRWSEVRRSRRAAPAPASHAASPRPMVVHRIDPERAVQLNPYVQVLTNAEDGRIAFGQFSGNALIVSTSPSFFELLPELRSGRQTLGAIRQHLKFRPEFESILQQLWHQKHLRYAEDWVSSGEEVRHSRTFGWLSNNTHAFGKERDVLQRLQQSCVTVLGVGGLGTHVVWNLAACGIGELHLVDGDVVELSNLNRQNFFTPADVGRYKVDVAEEFLRRFNPAIKIRKTRAFLRSVDELAHAIQGSHHVVRSLDMPMEVPMWVNEACVRMGIPYTGAGFFGQGASLGPTVIPGVSACLACDHVSNGLTVDRDHFGSIGPVISATAGLLSNEVVTCIAGLGTAKSINRLLWIDAPELNFREQDLQRNVNCSVCGASARERLAS